MTGDGLGRQCPRCGGYHEYDGEPCPLRCRAAPQGWGCLPDDQRAFLGWYVLVGVVLGVVAFVATGLLEGAIP